MSARIAQSDPPSAEDTDPSVQATLNEVKITLRRLTQALAVREENRDAELAEWKAIALNRTLPPNRTSLSELNPEYTPAGGVHIEAGAWVALQARIANLEVEKKLEAAEAKGAKEALTTEETKGDKFRSRITWAIAVGGPILAFLGWVLSHMHVIP
jgi:hypothetical protein